MFLSCEVCIDVLLTCFISRRDLRGKWIDGMNMPCNVMGSLSILLTSSFISTSCESIMQSWRKHCPRNVSLFQFYRYLSCGS